MTQMDSLQSCLSSLSPEVRRRIASHHELQGAALLPLVERLTDPCYLRELLQRLTEVERSALMTILFEGGEGLFPQKALNRRDRNITPSQLRIGMVRLRQKGLLFAQRFSWHEPSYFFPRDLYAAWLSVLAKQVTTRSSIQKVRSVQSTSNGMGHDLFHFLVMVGREDLPLTREGFLYKRILKRMDLELELEPDLICDTVWDNNEMPVSIALMTDLSQELQLVKKQQDCLVINPDRLAAWLHLSWGEVAQILFDWTKKKLLADRPSWYSLWWIMEQQTRGWVRFYETIAQWTAMARSCGRQVEFISEQIERELLRPLCGLGWIDLGETDKGICWRWKELAPCAKQTLYCHAGYVKPDFEVLIPAYYPLRERWMLAQFADYLGGEQMHMYLLHQESVQRGKKAGMDAEEMLAVLQKMSRVPIPANVCDGIRQSGSQQRRILLREMVLIEEEGGEGRKIHPYVKEQARKIGRTTFLIEKKKVETLIDSLKQDGYKVSWEEEERLPLWRRIRTCKPVVTWSETDQERELIDEYPDLETAIPGLSSLPQVWKSGLRAYHRSTTRDIVRKATEFNLDLLIEQAENVLYQFTPLRTENAGGVWIVEGTVEAGRNKRLRMDEIQRIQVLVPFG